MTTTDVDSSISRTYFGLRVGMVALAVLLYAGVVVQAIAFGCLAASISTYVYTPVRPVFTAALCAIGACLVIYRGNTTAEDALLNVAGFLAAIVAFVPTAFGADPRGCRLVEIEGQQDAIVNNVAALVLAGVFVLLVGSVHTRTAGLPAASRESRWSFGAIALLLAAVIAVFVLDPGLFLARAHGVAAALFFVMILGVIHLNAAATSGRMRALYRLFFWGPLVVGAGLGIARLLDDDFRTFLFWLETVAIAGFVGFWVVQTVELGGAVRRTVAPGTEAPPGGA